ncbi:MAG: VWA domain-containing protein [Cystobacter sp.]
MDARIVEFAEVLRQNGVRVSTSEVMDATRAAAEVGLQERAVFRAALRTTLIKREPDVPIFRRAFDAFFSGAPETFEPSLAQQLKERGTLEGETVEVLLGELRDQLPGMSPLAQAVLQGDGAALARLLRGGQLQLDLSRMRGPLQRGFFSRQLMGAAGVERARSEFEAFADGLRERGLPPEAVELVSRQLTDALRQVEAAARREVKRQADARIREPSASWWDTPVHRLGQAEVKQMQSAVRALAEKLKARLVRKRRSRREGALHASRTLRHNLPWDGVPLVPWFRTRRPSRPELVVLCDVSDSVRNASRMMLLFTHTLQSLFARVRSFVFVADVGEVTRHFKAQPVERAIELATLGDAVSLTANSDYGQALATFARHQLGSITRRTTVMIIGDGRNNHNAPQAWVLEELKRRCARLLWVCPEPRANWGLGDSEMLLYSKHCHQAVVVHSVAALSRLAEQLVPV